MIAHATRRIARWAVLPLALTFGRCAAPQDSPPTGGFDETMIDGTVRHAQGIELVDIDRDGDLDVVAALSLSDAVVVYLNPGNPEEAWGKVVVSGFGALVAMDVAVADFDGDGDLDIAAVGLYQRNAGPDSAGEIVWYENPGDPRGVWQTRLITGKSFLGPRLLTAGDLDGDGRPDLIVGAQEVRLPGQEAALGNGLWWFSNRGGQFAGPFPIDPLLPQVGTVILHDVDGSGTLDVIASGAGNREVSWYRNLTGGDGQPRFVKYNILRDIGGPWGMSLGNMDDDPEPELVVALTHTTSTSVRWYDPPDAPFGAWTETIITQDFGVTLPPDADPEMRPPPPSSPRVVAADFDGDGRDDVAVSTLNFGDLRVYFREAEGGWRRNDLRAGYRGLNHLQAADVDRDGRLDLITSTYDFGTRDRIVWWRNLP